MYVEYDCGRLPEPLFVADDDLTSVLMNVLEKTPSRAAAVWRTRGAVAVFRLCLAEGNLRWSAAIPPRLERRTVPASGTGRAHGFGLSILRGIAQRYDGGAERGPEGRTPMKPFSRCTAAKRRGKHRGFPLSRVFAKRKN